MNRKKLRKLAKNPLFIPGIYNYCDRWCERCPLTSRCLLYAMETESPDDPADLDLNNAAFWDKLRETFDETKKMIEEMAAQRGIDLSAIDFEAADRVQKRRRARVKKNELAQMAFRYTKRVDKWFKAEHAVFDEKEEELLTTARLGIDGLDPAADAAEIGDALEVMRWYEPQIYVKLSRALSSADNEAEFGHDDASPRDSDGSAKVALIGLDRSIAAWAKLREHFPDKGDSILDLLLLLEQVRRRAEARFPNARAFKRPGFDD